MVDLPQPELADKAERLARGDVEGDAGDRADGERLAHEARGKAEAALDILQRHGRRGFCGLDRSASGANKRSRPVGERCRMKAAEEVRRGRPLGRRRVAAANVGGVAAAGRETAGRRRVGQVGRTPGDGGERRVAIGRLARQRREQSFRVAMARVGEELGRRRGLDHLPGIHHRHPVGVLRDDAEIMRHEDHRHAELAAQVVKELEDLALDGDVERGRRLVGDEELRLADERDRDADALAQPARQLVRIGSQPLLRMRHAHELQRLDNPRPCLAGRQRAMQQQGLRNLVVDRLRRIERRHRILEDDADVVAANDAHLSRHAASSPTFVRTTEPPYPHVPPNAPDPYVPPKKN